MQLKTAASAGSGSETPRSLHCCVVSVVLGIRLMIVANVVLGQQTPKFQLFSAMFVVSVVQLKTAANVGNGVLDIP